MRLKGGRTGSAAIPLVPMIDVLMIMLVFFMVTSTYLNLRMIPMARGSDEPVAAAPAPSDPGAAGTLLIRLDSDGSTRVRGQPVGPVALADLLSDRIAATPGLNVVLLPSGGASTQDLVSLLDTTTRAGVRRLRVVRLGPAP